jgi:chromate reductase, NAD(P)H dehydrogenase (quinone)
MTDPRILAFAGSARPGSFNGKLLAVAIGAARALGAEVTPLDLRSLALPVYDAEIEAAGMPAGALELRRLLATHDALLIASPEYNGFPTPLLINSLDWVSRVAAGDGLPAGLATMGGKVAGVMSASPGPMGGLRSLGFARQFLHNTLGMLVVPEQFALVQAGKAFDEQGEMIDAKQMQGVQRVVASVVRVAGALKGPGAAA